MRRNLQDDDDALVGVQEDIIALAVVLFGFSIFVAAIFSSLLWVEETRKSNDFHDIGPDLADEITTNAELRAPDEEPGVLSLQSIERMALELADLNGNASTEFIHEHSLEEIGFLIIIETINIENTTSGESITFTAGLTEQYSFQWGSVNSDSLDEQLESSEQILSIRRPVSIVDENMPERVAPAYIQVIVWR